MVEALNVKQATSNRQRFNLAKRYLPGGVNSPVRSFRAVGGYPVFVRQGKGAKIYDEDKRAFIDYCLSWGALIFGHAHPGLTRALEQAIKNGTSFGTVTQLETELARMIVQALPSVEQVRLTSSGTEAVMSAIRLARAYTSKNKIIKFAGSYHGHADYLLVKTGSAGATLGIPDSLGVPKDFTKHTLILPYNNIEQLKETVEKNSQDLAAIIVEPVQANYGLILPRAGFLQQLRQISRRHKVVLIFDEVITGFRLSYAGAQGYFNLRPDLTCLGKIIGGGLPVGALGGKREMMQLLAPQGAVYQAGTLSGNPIAVTAGIVSLKLLKENNPYQALEAKTRRLCQAINSQAQEYRLRLKVTQLGSMFSIDTKLFKRFYQTLLKQGIYLSPSVFETNFLSTAHTEKDIQDTIEAINRTLISLRRQ